MVATAEVYQADVPRLKVGDAATVQVSDQAVTGKVTRIGSVVGKNQLVSLDPRALQDRRVVKVTISLDDPEPARRLVNMEVDVAIRPSAAGAAGAASPAVGQLGKSTSRSSQGNVAEREIEVNVAATWFRPRTPPLALRNVVHGGRRTLAAIAGVAFSLTMVLLQLGFLEAVRITAANNYEQLDFDIVLLSPRYEQFYAAGLFPLERLVQARSVEGVLSAAPMYATFNLWRCPAYPSGPGRRRHRPPPATAPGRSSARLSGRRCRGRSSAGRRS